MAACTPCRASGSAVAETTFQGIHRLASLWLAVMVSCTGPRTGFPPARFLASPGACFLGCTVWPRSFAGAADGQPSLSDRIALHSRPRAMADGFFSTLPWKGDERRLTTRPCNGRWPETSIATLAAIWAARLFIAVRARPIRMGRVGLRGGRGAALLIWIAGGPRSRPRATARRSCCGSRSGRELPRTTSSACA